MKVLEISNTAGGGYAGLLLAQLGFDVTRVALPGAEQPDVAAATADDLFFHQQKETLAAQTLRDFTDTERAACLASYDAVIEDVGAAGLRRLKLSRRAIQAARPAMMLVSISPFGLTGPQKDWHATDLTVQAAGGVLHATGLDGEAPRRLPVDAALMIAGLHAATAVCTGVVGIGNGVADGVHIDISAQDTLMQHWTRHVADYAYSGLKLKRTDPNAAGIHNHHTLRAADGWVFLLALREPWQDVAAFLGLGEFLTEDNMGPDAEQPAAAIDAVLADAVATKPRYQWFAEAADLGWTFAPVESPAEIAASPQTAARQGMDTVVHDGRALKLPALPYRFQD